MRTTSEYKKVMSEGGKNTGNKSAYGEIRVEKNKRQEREESKEMGFNNCEPEKTALFIILHTQKQVAGRMGEKQRG